MKISITVDLEDQHSVKEAINFLQKHGVASTTSIQSELEALEKRGSDVLRILKVIAKSESLTLQEIAKQAGVSFWKARSLLGAIGKIQRRIQLIHKSHANGVVVYTMTSDTRAAVLAYRKPSAECT